MTMNGMTRMEPRHVESNSNAPFHGYSHPSPKQTQQRSEVMEFEEESLPVGRQHAGKGKGEPGQSDRRSVVRELAGVHQGSQSPSLPHAPQRLAEGGVAASRPTGKVHHQQSRHPNAYPQHIPSALKNNHHHHHHHQDQDTSASTATSAPVGGARGGVARGGVKAQHKSLRVQFQPEKPKPHPHPYEDRPHPYEDRPHPLLYKSSGIPMRATKSAQTPSSDAPLTSYPRSHVEAMQRRSASNGRVQHQQYFGHTHQGMVPGGGVSRRFHSGHGRVTNTNNNNEMTVGSLV